MCCAVSSSSEKGSESFKVETDKTSRLVTNGSVIFSHSHWSFRIGMIRFSLSRIFDLENYWNWVGKKEPISAELYDNSGRTIFLPFENEMKRERCLVRSQHASRSCSRRVFLFSQRNVFLVNKKTQIELVGLVSTISICRLIVCFLSERSWSLCTHT